MAFAGLEYLKALPLIQSGKKVSCSLRLETTAASLPSGFRNAGAMISSLFEV